MKNRGELSGQHGAAATQPELRDDPAAAAEIQKDEYAAALRGEFMGQGGKVTNNLLYAKEMYQADATVVASTILRNDGVLPKGYESNPKIAAAAAYVFDHPADYGLKAGQALQFADPALLRDPDIVMAAIKQTPGQTMADNRDELNRLYNWLNQVWDVGIKPDTKYKDLPDMAKCERDVVFACIKAGDQTVRDYMPDMIKADREVQAALKKAEGAKGDPAVARAAIRNDGGPKPK